LGRKYGNLIFPSDFHANWVLSGRDEYENEKDGKVWEVAHCDF
jgi:hypothetical protein